MHLHFATLLPLSLYQYLVSAQVLASTQLTAFNSSFFLSQDQIAGANLNPSDAASIDNTINYERSQYAGGPTTEDAFYTLPSNLSTTNLSPGTLLSVEDFTNITNYTLPPNTALSRIAYVSRNLNGTLVPVSAFILWPFLPRKFSSVKNNSAPVVLWNHMTSGWFGPAAPSKHRALWAGDNAPFALALAGYAVVASDYAGLGFERGFGGEKIKHQYIAAAAAAGDVVFAFHAARNAFPDRLSEQYVTMGQSQGGGVSWGVSELLANETDLAKGFLGSISVSGTVNVFGGSNNYIGPFVGQSLNSVFPDFKIEEWLTPFGLGRFKVFEDTKASLATAMGLFTTSEEVAKDGIENTWVGKAYAKLANPGSKPIAGPLLVLQGTEDVFVPFAGVSNTVRATCEVFPKNEIDFKIFNGSGHVPTLDASRPIWMQWIQERFEGKELEKKPCGTNETIESFLPVERYQKTWNSFPMWVGSDVFSYQQPLGL